MTWSALLLRSTLPPIFFFTPFPVSCFMRLRGDMLLLACLLLLASAAHAQDSTQKAPPKSPVFKGYRPPDQLPLLGPPDETYQSWLAFLATQKANAGDVLAQHELGIRYLLGRGVARDTTRAAYWIGKAAEQNLLPARFNLAIMDYHGWGVPWDPFAAFRNIEYCAEHDMPDAEFVMGEFYTENLIVPQDLARARGWLKKAADAGYKPAVKVLEDLERRMSLNDSARAAQASQQASVSPLFLDAPDDTISSAGEWTVLKNALANAGPELSAALGLSRMLDGKLDVDSLSFHSIEVAADRGSPEALSVLARCYEKGIMVKRDLVQAAVQYIRAIRMDSPRSSQLLLKMLQEKGFLSELKRRAEADEPDAEFALAGLAALGFDTYLTQGQAMVTGDQALHFLRKAGAKNYQPALIELSLCSYNGRWVSQDLAQAVGYLEKAAALGNREAEVRLAIITVRDLAGAGNTGAAIDTLMRASQEGSILAEVALGYCYETGRGVTKSIAQAASLYTDGATRGSQDAYRALRRLLDAIRPSDAQFHIDDFALQ